MAQGLDDAALEALASRGLLRRATADAGRVRVEREDERSADLILDGETVRLDTKGLATSTCTCPAPGICRHRLAAAIHLRGATAEAASTDWAAVFDAIGIEELARYAGRSGWRNALVAAPEVAVEIKSETSSLTVRLGTAEPVVFLAVGGLDAAITKAALKDRKACVVAAALAARRALGLPPPAIETNADADLPAQAPDSRVLREVRDFLCRVYGTGLAIAPMALEEEARTLALAGRVEAMPRVSGLLRSLAAGIGTLRRREADADSEALLALAAECHALCVALDAAPSEQLRIGLAGQVRQDYASISDLALVGLGARLWETTSGAHGATAHLFDAEGGRAYTASLARPDRTDPLFTPVSAFRQTAIWGTTMAELCAGRVHLAGAQASPAGRLSAAASVTARVEPWTPTREAVAGWSCAFDDWAALEASLQSAFTPRLAAGPLPEVPVVLIFSRHATARFDEISQSLVWPLADARRRWVGLTLRYEGPERDRIPVLERLVASARFWAVLAVAALDGGRIELRPYALWGEAQQLLDFDARPSDAGTASRSLLDRLRRLGSRPANGPAGPVTPTHATDAVLNQAWARLLRRAESGGMQPADVFAREAGRLAGRLEPAGFVALAKAFRGLAVASPDMLPALGLRSAYMVSTLRRARARLVWME
ncbi:hypothetical protein BWR60_23750 [Inquilinus limosus]|uniref:SWIM-type domain-containing protein n=2 Tax=Inquilinus limosus TaxID=171674 RepID=A0A211ZHP1_9PROT|nr:hypothetical protein BWR60_23750 [Inquilinus limosus]